MKVVHQAALAGELRRCGASVAGCGSRGAGGIRIGAPTPHGA